MVAIDGTTLDVVDTDANAAEFGRPGVNKGEQSAFPQARLVAIAECGTRAMFDAVVGAYSTGENTMAVDLVERLKPGMLLLAECGFCGYPLWARAQATGADLLWRAKADMKPRHVATLDDGTWIGELRPAGNAGRTAEPLRIRVFEAADHAKVDTDRVSFVAALRFARRSISQARDFPPHEPDGLWRHVVVMLARRLNPPRRRRSNPRLVKRKMPKWHVKRKRHRDWPQPDNRPPRISPMSF